MKYEEESDKDKNVKYYKGGEIIVLVKSILISYFCIIAGKWC
jgi:hypothetical protein